MLHNSLWGQGLVPGKTGICVQKSVSKTKSSPPNGKETLYVLIRYHLLEFPGESWTCVAILFPFSSLISPPVILTLWYQVGGRRPGR